jgi:hypothetical protein
MTLGDFYEDAEGKVLYDERLIDGDTAFYFKTPLAKLEMPKGALLNAGWCAKYVDGKTVYVQEGSDETWNQPPDRALFVPPNPEHTTPEAKRSRGTPSPRRSPRRQITPTVSTTVDVEMGE